MVIIKQYLDLRDVVRLEDTACCEESSSEYSHGGRESNSKRIPYAKKLFFHCNRKTAGSSHLGLEESKKESKKVRKKVSKKVRKESKKVTFVWKSDFLRHKIRRLQSKFLPTTSFRHIIKNIFKDQHIEIRRDKFNYS